MDNTNKARKVAEYELEIALRQADGLAQEVVALIGRGHITTDGVRRLSQAVALREKAEVLQRIIALMPAESAS